MIKLITVRRAGGSVSTTIPKDLAERYKVAAGDTIFAVETERGILLTPYDPKLERAMQIYEQGAKKYRHALKALAE
jgi:antitoxin MazE